MNLPRLRRKAPLKDGSLDTIPHWTGRRRPPSARGVQWFDFRSFKRSWERPDGFARKPLISISQTIQEWISVQRLSKGPVFCARESERLEPWDPSPAGQCTQKNQRVLAATTWLKRNSEKTSFLFLETLRKIEREAFWFVSSDQTGKDCWVGLHEAWPIFVQCERNGEDFKVFQPSSKNRRTPKRVCQCLLS